MVQLWCILYVCDVYPALMDETDPRPGNEVKSVRKAIRLVEALQELDGARVTELANHLEWPKSTIHSHVETLENCGYVVKEGDVYYLGLRFMGIGEYVKHRDEVYSLVEPRIEALADRTGERVQFVTEEHGESVFIRIAAGEHAVRTGTRIGRPRRMLHATASGKAILAFKPEEEVREIVRTVGLPEFTPNTITDEDALFAELEEIRDRGVAFNYEEHIEGLRAVAAPVKRQDGSVVGSIAVSGPAHRMQGEQFSDELPTVIRGVCNEIELDIVYAD